MERSDPFAILHLPRRYDLDAATIEQHYLERVAEMHPDLAASAAMGNLGEDDQEAEQRASELNEARRLLADPEQRAIVLWRLLGGKDDKTLAPEFLMEMMGIREEMQSATGASDRALWESWTRHRRLEHSQRVGGLFARIEREGTGAAPELLQHIRRELNAWRYIERMAEQIA